MDCGAGGADGAEKPNQSNANREAPSLVNVMQVCSRSAPCFILDVFHPKKSCRQGGSPSWEYSPPSSTP